MKKLGIAEAYHWIERSGMKLLFVQPQHKGRRGMLHNDEASSSGILLGCVGMEISR